EKDLAQGCKTCLQLLEKQRLQLGGREQTTELKSNSWMKHVRSTCDVLRANLAPLQMDGEIIYRALCDIDCGEELLLRAGDSTSPDSDDEETAQVMAQGEAYLQRFTKKVCFTTHKDFCGATLFWRHILMHCRPLCFLSSRYRESGELCSVVDVRLSAPIRTDVLTSPNI
ncbi:hypothetical protein NP493_545g01050, partial [Ridgeia piscesae]